MIGGTVGFIFLILILCSILALIIYSLFKGLEIKLHLDKGGESSQGTRGAQEEGNKPKTHNPEGGESCEEEEEDTELEEDIKEEIRDLSKKPQTEDIKNRIKGLEDLLEGKLTPSKPPVPLYDKDKGDWVKKGG